MFPPSFALQPSVHYPFCAPPSSPGRTNSALRAFWYRLPHQCSYPPICLVWFSLLSHPIHPDFQMCKLHPSPGRRPVLIVHRPQWVRLRPIFENRNGNIFNRLSSCSFWISFLISDCLCFVMELYQNTPPPRQLWQNVLDSDSSFITQRWSVRVETPRPCLPLLAKATVWWRSPFPKPPCSLRANPVSTLLYVVHGAKHWHYYLFFKPPELKESPFFGQFF